MRVFRAAQVFAFPIIDRERRITGVVDVSLFNEEVFGIPKTESGDELFQAIGFHISQARQASPLQLFRFRFPWLLVTISAGTICAFLTRAHEKTLQHTLVVAFFLTLVLALGESVAVQSLALVLEAFRLRKVTLGWFLATCRCEALTALPLAVAAGAVVFMVVLILDHALWPALIISGSIAFAVGAACLLGISIPTLLHVAKLDLTIAAGPITLALTDIVTLLVCLSLTSVLLWDTAESMVPSPTKSCSAGVQGLARPGGNRHQIWLSFQGRKAGRHRKS